MNKPCILVIYGLNLNLLGKRELDRYEQIGSIRFYNLLALEVAARTVGSED